jgi:hypothetical protein
LIKRISSSLSNGWGENTNRGNTESHAVRVLMN